MERLACVDLPSFALQNVLRRHPEWKGEPVAVVTRPTLQGELLEVCKRARRGGARPGMTLAAALGLVPDLRVEGVMEIEVASARTQVEEVLWEFSPNVESSKTETGTYWLDASGMERLYESLVKWGEAVRAKLRERGFYSSIVIGFGRFGTYALARAARGSFVVRDPHREVASARQVHLSQLGLRSKELAQLAKLGRTTVGDLVDLPSSGVLARFGSDLHRLRAWASGELWSPMQPAVAKKPILRRFELDEPETNAMRLTFLVKGMLHGLLADTAARHCALYELELRLELERHETQIERLQPAEPTLDEAQLIDLVRLRFERLFFRSGVAALELEAHCVSATREQLELFARKPKRDPVAAQRAFARLRAEFGSQSVLRAEIVDSHLPEAEFTWLSYPPHKEKKRETKGQRVKKFQKLPEHRTLVRRIYARPVPLLGRPVCGPRGCHLAGMDHPPFANVRGPFVVSGNWWSEQVHREYHFAEAESGEILWVFFDCQKRRWFIHGEVT